MTKIRRLYKGKDGNMISKISSALFFFEKHLADFTAFDPELDAAYLAAWKAARDNAGNDLVGDNDEKILFQEHLALQDADQALDPCRAKYKDVKYFASKAFPANREVMREFGEGQYSKVCNSHLQMVQFMEQLYGVAMKYKTQLIAKNYTQPAIDEIKTLADNLRTRNQNQQLKKKERPTDTRQRIETLNTFYAYGQQVRQAAKEVYRDNAVLRNEFKLALRHHPDVIKRWFTVGVNGRRKTGLKKIIRKYKLTLVNQSEHTVEYWFSDGVRKPTGEIFSLAPKAQAAIAHTDAHFFFVRNNNVKPSRMMLVMAKIGI